MPWFSRGQLACRRLTGRHDGTDASIELILVPPVLDDLHCDPELCSDLSDWSAGLNQIEHLATELDRVPPGHDGLLISARNSSIPIA